MAAKKGEYLSPGIYRDPGTGKTYRSKTGALPNAKNLTNKPKTVGLSQSKANKNLTKDEQAIIADQNKRDITMGGVAGKLQGQVSDTLSTPFNYEGPKAYEWNDAQREDYFNRSFNLFKRQDDLLRQQENEDLARWSQSTGNSVDSPAYQAKAKQLANAQNARLLDANDRARLTSTEEQQTAANVANEAFRLNYGQAIDKRQMPLNEYGQVQGFIKGYDPYSGYQLSQRGEDLGLGRQKQLATHTAGLRPSGGGGGIVSPPQTYQPAYLGGQNQSTPSYGSQLASSLGSPVAQGIGSYVGKNLPNWISSLFSSSGS